MEPDPELAALREAIVAIDRETLDALNRRLALVARIRDHKRETGAPVIDARREAELLAQLTAANAGPLTARGVHAIFAAVLDVMKQETQGAARAEAPPRLPAPPVGTVAIVGTGLVGGSVALAARRAGCRVRGWDAHGDTLRAAAAARAVEAAASLGEAVAGAELVVLAVPVGGLVDAARAALATAAPEATVTDVGSTKRSLAREIADPRFVPGHPLAGGSTGGPGRSTADLFDGATWFITPTEHSSPACVALVERFVESLGAHAVRMDAATHDNVLAVTSHLPHALANVLMTQVARAGDDTLAHAGAALREMTRVAGANPAVWSDIFVENGDLIAAAVASQRTELEALERALREGDRAFFERWIAAAAEARGRMLEHAYRTAAKNLNRIRVRVPDKPGVLARITQTLGAAEINIEDFELRHVSPEYGGVLVILVAGNDKAEEARSLLRRDGYSAV
ncbi:MAG: prephenate dehydrogenase/arogenate dehydrogenase family protein [Gaiellaceae bacterium]